MISRRNGLIPPKEKASRKLGGFTLIEVLLGLLIFSMIAGGLYGTFRGGLAVSRRVGQVNTGYREIRWIFEQMASDFENAVSFDFANSYPNLKAFEGSANSLRILVSGPEGLVVVTYAIKEPAANSVFKTIVNRKAKKKLSSVIVKSEEGKGTKILERSVQPFLNFLKQDTQGTEREVLSFLIREDGLHFSYTNGLLPTGQKLEWQSSWTSASFPSMVKVQLVLANFETGSGDLSLSRQFWVPLGTPLKIDK